MRLLARPAVRAPSAWLLAVTLAVIGLNSLVGATPAHARAIESAAGAATCHDPVAAGTAASHSHSSLPECCADQHCPCGGSFAPPAVASATLPVGRAPRAASAAPLPAARLRANRLLRPPIVALR